MAAIVPGTMAGSFKVSGQGNANYTIPIQVPAGTAGMQPGLTLSYSNGGAGVGLLGQGWTLTGLGAVARCPATIAQDGRAGGVHYDAGDKFCLDGVRLVKVSSGTEAGALYWEYRTELESFARVRAYGSATNAAQNVEHNPSYWEVLTKTGQRMLYGATKDSQIEGRTIFRPQPTMITAVRLWALGKVEDKKGNYLTVKYTEGQWADMTGDPGNEFYPIRIDYTGNTGAGLAPKQSVVFTYEQRPDSKSAYFAGDLLTSTQRLTSIRTYVSGGATLVRDYRIAYTSGLLGRSLVSEIQECGGDNRCYAPTQFAYKGGSDGLKPVKEWLGGVSSSAKVGDFNGDGLTDLYDIQAGQAAIALSERTRFANLRPWGAGLGSDTAAIAALDLNGDGKSDLLQFEASGTAKAWLSTGSAFQPARPWGSAFNVDPARNAVVDVDGDGTLDVLNFGLDGTVRWHKGSTTGFAAPVPWATGVLPQTLTPLPTSGSDSMAGIRVGDLDGDGRPDILTLNLTPGANSFKQEIYRVFLNQGASAKPPVDWYNDISVRTTLPNYHVSDVNGDGRDDLVLLAHGPPGEEGAAVRWLSTGRLFAMGIGGKAKGDDGLLDLNADGLSDLVRLEMDTKGESVALKTAHNNGTTFGDWSTATTFDPRTFTSTSGGACATVTGTNDARSYCTSNKFDGGTTLTCSKTKCTQFQPDGTTCVNWTGTVTAANCFKYGALGMQTGDFNGDGRLDVALLRGLEKKAWVSVSNEGNTDALVAVTNGIGHRTEVDYAPLTNPLYVPETAAPPLQLLVGAAYVVSAVREVNAVNGMKTTSFQYWNGKIDPRGRNFLGFRQMAQYTSQVDGSLLVTSTQYAQDFPYVGSPLGQTKEVWFPSSVITYSKKVLSTTKNEYATKVWTTPGQPTRYFPYTSKSIVSGNDLDGSVLPTTTTVSTFDDEGNLTKSVVTSGDITTTTTNTFAPADKTRWIWGRLSRAVTTKTDGVTTKTRKAAFEYDLATGILTKEVVEPDDAAMRMETKYGYDAFGNKTSTTVSAADVPARVSTAKYDLAGRFVVEQTNAANHTVKSDYADPKLDIPTITTDANGLSTTRTYDSLGRLLTEKRPDGVVVTTKVDFVGGGIVYDHPTRICANGVDLCATPARARTSAPLPVGPAGTKANGCSLGYWFTGSGAGASCTGNPVNGVCPQSMDLGSFDVAEPRIGAFSGVPVTHVQGLLCYPANVPVYSLGAALVVTTTIPGMPTTKVYTDVLGREVRREQTGFDGRLVIEEQVHDADGRVIKKSLPYFAGETAYWVQSKYDALGRVIEVKTPDSAVTTTAYKGLTKIVTNPKLQATTFVSNAQGKLVTVTDAKKGVISNKYDPNGDLVETRDPAGNVTSMVYDTRGRKTSLLDPDMGRIEYTYNGVGEATGEQTPALRAVNKWIRNTYDAIGRVKTRDEAGALSTWVYDACPKGIGRECSATSAGYSRVTTYDTLSRPSTETVTLDGTAFKSTTTYDALSRVDSVTYPSGLKLQNQYNTAGHLVSMKDATSGTVYWRGLATNASGQFIKEQLGSGVVTVRTIDPAAGTLTALQSGPSGRPKSVQNASYTYDKVRNLKTRDDLIASFAESFDYDELSRLTTVTPTKLPTTLKGTKPGALTMGYDDIGNITSKSDVGVYTYGALAHAVTRAGAKTYTYDENGNMKGGDGRTLTWTAFNMPKRMSHQNGAFSEFSYTPERHRYKQVSNVETTYYVSSAFERVVRGNVTSDRTTIAAGHAPLVQITKRAGATETRYFHHDHQESVSVITNESGAVVERLGYDAFGKRRHPDGSNASAITVQSGVTRGYTGHEMLDGLGLVHMNGRIQDPVLGRFLSADPFVQAPEASQSYNRYSYCVNNPLSFTDPSGYFLELLGLGLLAKHHHRLFTKYKRYILAVAAIAFIFIPGLQALLPAVMQAVLAVGVLKAAIVGAIMGFAMGGTLKSALMGAFTGALGYGIGVVANGNIAVEVMAHGMTGGMMNVANGGDFFSGFLASAVSAYFAPKVAGWASQIAKSEALRTCVGTAASAVLGGATSVLGGGKFENGAVSASFSYLVGRIAETASRPHDFLPDVARILERDLNGLPNPDAAFGGPATLTPIPAEKWSWGVDARYPELRSKYPAMDNEYALAETRLTGEAVLNAGDYRDDWRVSDMVETMIHETLHANESPAATQAFIQAPGLYDATWHRLLDIDANRIARELGWAPSHPPASW